MIHKLTRDKLPFTEREKRTHKGYWLLFLIIAAYITPTYWAISHNQYVNALEKKVSHYEITTQVKPAQAAEPVKEEIKEDGVLTVIGKASYYDYVLDSGWSSKGHYVAATRDFKRYSMVRVTNLTNNKSVEVKITDYGPDASIFPDRVIDLSSTAFAAIADTKLGVVDVMVEQL